MHGLIAVGKTLPAELPSGSMCTKLGKRGIVVDSGVRIALLLLWLGALACPAFDMRGYYITFMRTPTLDLAAWKQTIDCVGVDGGNTVLLWMGGAFPSKKFPITWKYNAGHLNVRKNFAGKLIDYAHEQHIKVILGFTPF